MCGLFISNYDFKNKNIESIIEKNLRFRGPDGSSGILKNNGWISYHSRLAIIDLSSTVNQPVINSDSSQLVFNGEILNYKELGLHYFNKEYNSDTFLLNDLIVFEKLNLSELDGFFSFVFIDGDGKIKYACRDKFGVKPLFFHKSNEQITFASEPNVLQDLFSPSINEEAVEEYKAFRAPIFEGSFYNSIQQVDPGHCFINGRFFSAEIELLNAKKSSSSKNNETLKKAIKQGVKSRCVSDAPVGLLLSKGIDSNLIKHTEDFKNMYSVGFCGDEDIEYLSDQNIDGLKILNVDKDEFVKAFDYLLSLRKEPLSVPNEVLLYLIALKAKGDGIKVLLSGEGADEFFGGYDRIFTWAANNQNFDLESFLELYAYTEIKKGSKLYQKMESLFSNCTIKNTFELVRWFFIRYHMPILFRRLDFSLMAAGVEGREPIANAHLFSVCSMLSGDDLMINGLGKKPLREILSEYLGEDFAYANKVGFPVDLTKIFSNPDKLSSYELWFSKNLEVLR